MLISAREAARRLEEVGVTRRQTRRLIALGFAGAPVTTPSTVLVEEDRVAALADRPRLTGADLDRWFPHGVFVARRDVDLRPPKSPSSPSSPPSRLLEQVRSGWEFSPYTGVWIRVLAGRHGHVPLVATTCGFVALGADITGVRAAGDGRYVLELTAPGDWFAGIGGARLVTARGRPWVLHRGPADGRETVPTMGE